MTAAKILIVEGDEGTGRELYDELERQGFEVAGIAATEEKAHQMALPGRDVERQMRGLIEAAPDALLIKALDGRILDCNAAACEMFGYSREELLQLSTADLVPQELAESLRETMTKERSAEPQVFETWNQRKDGRVFPVRVSTQVLTLAGEARLLAYVRDITERRQAEDALRRRAGELDALQATILDIIVPHDLPTLLETITERAVRLLDAPIGGLYLYEPEQQLVRCVVSFNTPRDYRGITMQLGEGTAGAVAETGRPLSIEDYSTWPGRSPTFEEDRPFRAVITAPMIWQGAVIGVIDVVHYDENERFTEEDLDLLTSFAHYAAIAVENVRLHEQAQEEIAERKRLEQVSEERRLYLESVLDCTPDAIVTTDARHIVSEWNPGAEQLFGYTPQEAVGHDLDELITAPDKEMLQEATGLTQRVLDGEPVLPFETIRYRKDGTSVHVTAAGAPILVEGRLVGVVAAYTDITHRKEAEEALRESEQRYALATSAGQVGVWDWDLETGEIYVDPVLKAMLGYQDHEIRNHLDDWGAHVHPDDAERVMAAAQAHLEGQTPYYEVAHRMVHKDGSTRWFLARGTAIRDAEGNAYRVVGTDTDITERKEMEEALLESEERYRSLVENVPIGVYRNTTGPRGRFLMANPAFLNMFGLDSEQELARMHVSDFYVDPAERETFSNHLLAEGSVTGVELLLRKKDGTPLWGSVTARVIRDEQGEAAYFDCTIEDITQRKEVEREIRWLKEFNESIVQNMAEGIAVQDERGYFTFLNPAAANLLGYEVEELIGEYWTQIVPPDQQPIIAAADERRKGGKADRYEVELQHKDGSRLPVLVSGNPRFSDGDFEGTLAVFTDIRDRVEAEETLTRRAQEMAALYETSLEINAQPDLPTLLQAIVKRAAELLGAPIGALYLMRHDDEVLELTVVHNLPPSYVGRTFSPGEGLSGRVAETGRPRVISDYRAWEGKADAYADDDFRRVLGVPLMIKGRVIGVINVTDQERTGTYDEDEIRLVSLFADQAAIAIENARLLEAEARRRREAETLQAATQALSATLDLQRVFELILSELQKVVPYDSATVQQLKEEHYLEIIGGHGFPNLEELLGVRFDLTAQDNPNREVVQQQAPRILEDAAAAYEEFRREPHAQAGVRSWLGVPLFFGDRLIGMLALDKTEPGFYTQEHAQLAQAFAAQAAIAIENARLFQETEQRLDELATLFEASAVLSTTLDTDTVLHTTAREICTALDVDGCAISAWDREKNALVTLLDYPHKPDPDWWEPDAPGTTYALADSSSSRLVLYERRPLAFRVSDANADPAAVAWMEAEDVQALLLVPLVTRDEVMGLVEVFECQQERQFTPNEIRTCQTMANLAASALENARLFEAEREQRQLAERLHETSLLVNSSLDHRRVLDLILDQLGHVVPYDSGSIQILEEDATRVLAARNLPTREMGRRYPLAEFAYNRELVEREEPIIIRDVRSGERGWQITNGLEQVRSNIGLPLKVRDRIIGILTIDSHRPGTYTGREAHIAQAFAQQAALAIENARLFEAEREQRELAEALRRATAAVSSTLDLDQVLDHILEQMNRVIPSDAANIMLIEGDQARVVRWRGYDRFGVKDVVQSVSFPVAETPNLQRMHRTGEALILPDTRSYEGWVDVPEQSWIRSYAGAPIRMRSQVIGFLNADSATRGYFGPAHVDRLRAFADEASLALENARLYEAEQRRAREAAAVSAVAQALNATTDLDTVCQVVARELGQVLSFDRLSLALLSEDQTQFTIYALSARGSEALPRGVTMPTAATACAPDILSGQPHLTLDLATERDLPGEQALYGAGFRSRLNLPLVLGETIIGSLNLASQEVGAFEPDQLPFLSQVADAVAGAVQNAQLHEESQRRNRELALLNRVIAASAASQAIEPILETVCRELALAFDVPQAAAALFDEDRTEAVVVAEYLAPGRPSSLGEVIPAVGNPSSQYLLKHKRPLVVADAQRDPRLTPIHHLMRRRGTESLLVLPLIVGDQVVGSLGLDAIEPRPFSDKEVDLALRVAEQVSGALARARLVEAQRRLSAAVEQAAEAVLIADTDGNILYANPAFERITGYSRSELAQGTLQLFQSKGLQGTLYDRFQQSVAAGEVWQGRHVGQKKDGSIYTEETTIAPVRDQEGDIVNYVVTMRDVTREVQLEEQFYQAQKMEALGQLAGGIAHDFNNLLTVIQMSTQLMQRRLHPEDPLWEHVVRVQETGERATKLTKQLLSFSRREVIEPQVFSLNQVVGDLSRMLQRIIGEDVRLQIALAEDLWRVRADPSQMDQVILNLAVNARDAMPRGGVLTIETANVVLDRAYADTHMDARPGEHVRLTIRDTGVGMDRETQSHLFEPFFTTKEPGQGTGLGLATVFGIVRQADGHLRVHSEVGEGTTFEVYLPRTDEKGAVEAARPQRSTGNKLAQGTETILVVEDKADVRKVAADVLRSCGYRVLEARDGQEALRVSEQHGEPIHLLLTDVVMPYMNGRELAQALGARRPETRVLYMSGYADDATLEHMSAFLAKPFTAESLARRARMALDAKT